MKWRSRHKYCFYKLTFNLTINNYACLYVGLKAHLSLYGYQGTCLFFGKINNRVYNFTTGPYSTNYADITNKFDADVKNINDAIIENDITAKVRTGRNSASYNTLGGDIDTGNAEGDIDVNSEGNINTTTISTALGGFDNVAGNDLTGPFSDNQEDIYNKQEIEVENWNNKCKSHNADRLGENNEVSNFNWEWPWKTG